jgi:hypothetical protein
VADFPVMALPTKYTEIELKLGEPLAQMIAARRASGVSWRRIAMEINARTGVDIAGETLRVWTDGVSPVSTGRRGAA